MNKWNSLPTWAKGVIAVVSVVALAGLGFAIYKGVKKGIENIKEGKEDKEFQKETKDELEKLEDKGVSPTLSDSAAISLANLVQTSLSGCELSGTEDFIVKSILEKVNNQADWVKLQNTYGIRETDNCGIGTGDTKQDLKGILGSDLDAFGWNFKVYINVLKEGLQQKGITW